MHNEIMISIAMITYNQSLYIRHALESILTQETEYTYEIIIGDDCSSDGTVQIIQEYEKNYPQKIKPICRKTNIGPTRNAYDILTKCSGKYVAFLEGDDYFTEKNKIQKQVQFLENNPEYKSCAHRLEIVDKNENHLLFTLSDLKLNRPMNAKYFARYNTDMLHLNSLVFVNFIKNNPQKYRVIYESNKWSCHSMILLLCLQMSDIYVFEDSMTVWRFINESGKTNYTSQATEKQLQFTEEKLQLYKTEKEYFNGSFKYVSFSMMLAECYWNGLRNAKKIDAKNYQKWRKIYASYLNNYERTICVIRVLLKIKTKEIKRRLQAIIRT